MTIAVDAGAGSSEQLTADIGCLTLSECNITAAVEDTSPAAMGLQLKEHYAASTAETDLQYAVVLQLEEALQASVSHQGAEQAYPSAPAAETPSQTYVALQMQVTRAILGDRPCSPA